jgi:hypothetical protein
VRLDFLPYILYNKAARKSSAAREFARNVRRFSAKCKENRRFAVQNKQFAAFLKRVFVQKVEIRTTLDKTG